MKKLNWVLGVIIGLVVGGYAFYVLLVLARVP